MRKNEDESQDEGDLEAQAEQHQNEDDAAAEDDNATQPNIPSEQEEEEEAEGDNNVNPTEEEDDATAPPPKKKKPVIVWDPDTDPVVVNVRQFFEENPEGPVSQQSVLVQVDEAGDEVKVPIGKTMYTLRTKSRHEKPTQMTQDRLKALQDLPQFVAFLQQPTVSKPKPSAEIAHMAEKLREAYEDTNRKALKFETFYLQNMARATELEQQIQEKRRKFEQQQKQRQQKQSKKRKS